MYMAWPIDNGAPEALFTREPGRMLPREIFEFRVFRNGVSLILSTNVICFNYGVDFVFIFLRMFRQFFSYLLLSLFYFICRDLSYNVIEYLPQGCCNTSMIL